jgi:UDP-GlcNAc:undecaprenyl-phosphate GlcNAc-1-phosphate transferase
MFYLYTFLAVFVLAIVLTMLVRKLAQKCNVMDLPTGGRKHHTKPTPLLGGLAIFLAFFITAYFLRNYLLAGNLEMHHWLGVFIGAAILMLGGWLDDKYNLQAKWQLLFPVLAALAVIAGGVEVSKITNPFGGMLYLDTIKIPILAWGGGMHNLVLIADLFAFLWLTGMMYTTKLLDGLDGLVSGVAGVGSLIIFLFTMTTQYFQPDIGLAALILAAACFGYLVLAWYPGKIFLGEGGALFLGFMLGVLSIISGGKIAIALLIMGIPILDVIWTVARRILNKENPFKTADRKHLHFKLLDSGLGTRKTVLIYYGLAAVFGLCTLFLQSQGKFVSLVVLGIIMLLIISGFTWLDRKSKIV